MKESMNKVRLSDWSQCKFTRKYNTIPDIALTYQGKSHLVSEFVHAISVFLITLLLLKQKQHYFNLDIFNGIKNCLTHF